MVDIQFLKGPSVGKRSRVTRTQAAGLAKIGYLKVIEAEEQSTGAKQPDSDENHQNPPDISENIPNSSDISPITGRPKRQYRRRDLTAEK